MDDPQDVAQVTHPLREVQSSEDTPFEILTKELGALPTRVIVVEELRNCGVISKKKARKRIEQLLDESGLADSV